MDEKTQNQYEYWFTVQYLKTLYKDNYYALSALGMMNPDSGRFLRKIHNIYFNDTRMFFDADVVLINETVHTQKRILVSTTNFEWENQTEKSTYEKIKMVDYMGFSDVSFLSNDTLSTELSDEIFEQAKTKVAELNEYVELGYDLTLNSTMQDKNAADNPDNLTFVVQFTKGDETRMAYVSMQIENATGTATFYNVKLYVSDPMVENWSDLQ